MPFSIPKVKINNPLAGKSREDRTILLLCFGIAFFFWVLVKLSQEYTAEKEVALQFRTPAEKTFLVPPPASVPVKIKGSGWNLFFEFISSKRILLVYDVEGANSYFLSRSQFRSDVITNLVSKDLVIEDLNFEGIQLSLEDQYSTKVPIVVPTSFTFKAEHQLARPVTTIPDSIVLLGPRSIVSTIDEWPTDTLVLKDLSVDYAGIISLQQLEPGVKTEPDQVEVQVDVEQYTQKSLFVPVTVLNPPEDSIRIFPEKIKVNCVVGMQYYNELDSEDFTLVADLANLVLSEGKNTVPLELTKQPDFIKSILLNRRSAEFYIIKREEQEVVED